MKKTLAVLTFLFAPMCLAQTSDALLNDLFQDHLVFQREAPISIWGIATPNDTITISIASAVATTTANEDGSWSVQLPALPGGGPYTLEARSEKGGTQTIADIMIGDVFLCSGQSNMELSVSRTLNAPTEIRNATNDRIRMLTINKATNPAPLEDFADVDKWEIASPETVPDWSAVCYYFARELQKYVDVPVGLINSSWGGSNIRAWMNAPALREVGGYEDALSLLRLYAEDQASAQQTFGAVWETWWRAQTGDALGEEPWQPQAGTSWPIAPAGLGNWKEWGVPELAAFHGMVWFRTTFELTAAQAEQDAILSLGGIDEVDQTWINGHVVGNTFGWGTGRTYTIPAAQLQEGENIVVVNVLNTYGAGGMVGDPAQRFLGLDGGDKVALGTWRYKLVLGEVGMPPRTPWEAVGGLTTIHNAMVAPLRDYGLKGVLWYQGESNTGEAGEYLVSLRALMAQWRAQFGTDLPVLVVQLTNYGKPSAKPTESGWAEVREAERLATQTDPHAGLAVTFDLGDVYDIHPANKQEVGRRLVQAARHVIYGEEIFPSGPVPSQVTADGETVVVSFEDVEGALVAYGHIAPIGFELCGSERGSCQYAGAQIEGQQVRLQADIESEITRVRYCWADSPICTLYDTSGLPAGPFEMSLSGTESNH